MTPTRKGGHWLQHPLISALPPKADIIPHCVKCPLIANSGHWPFVEPICSIQRESTSSCASQGTLLTLFDGSVSIVTEDRITRLDSKLPATLSIFKQLGKGAGDQLQKYVEKS